MDDYDIRWEQVIIEELAYARCSDWFGSLHSRIVAPYITRFGTEAQIERYIPGAVSGDIILAVAMTEPDAGSNLAGMRTHAVEHDDHWQLSGQKTYISNGINCDLGGGSGENRSAKQPSCHYPIFGGIRVGRI
jgi:acyl-CoA dehydrogenase